MPTFRSELMTEIVHSLLFAFTYLTAQSIPRYLWNIKHNFIKEKIAKKSSYYFKIRYFNFL